MKTGKRALGIFKVEDQLYGQTNMKDEGEEGFWKAPWVSELWEQGDAGPCHTT